jgi:hypothetical protein
MVSHHRGVLALLVATSMTDRTSIFIRFKAIIEVSRVHLIHRVAPRRKTVGFTATVHKLVTV